MQWWAYVLIALTVVSLGIAGFAGGWCMRLYRSRQQLVQTFRAVMQGSADAIVLEDANGRITHWSSGAQAMFGYSAEEMLGQTRQRLIPADEIQQDDARGVNLRVSKSGSVIPVTTTYTPIRDDRGQRVGLCCVMRDRQVATTADELIRALSFNDSLTGLPNWRLLRDRLWRAQLSSGRRKTYFAVLYVDLDDFKTVNDRHGEAAGDRLLVEVAARLMAAVRQKDTVARLMGDEFVILLEDLGQEEAHARNHANAVADKVLDLMEARSFELSSENLACSASIGIQVVQGGNGYVDDLIKLAGDAMAQVKKGRRMVASGDFAGNKRPSPL